MKTAPFERIRRFAAHAARRRRQQSALRADAGLARVEEQEQPRSVGDLPLARAQARLPEERRLLIARNARNGDRMPADAYLAHARVAVSDLGQDPARNGERAQQLLVPRHRMNVEQHGAGGVRDVGDERTVFREFVDQITVDRSRTQLAFAEERAHGGNMLKIPYDLACGKVRVRNKPRARPHELFRLRVERGAPCARTAALPADDGADRLARLPIPHDDRLALVGDPDARHVLRPRDPHTVVDDVCGFIIDLVRVLFHPTRTRKRQPDRLLRAVNEPLRLQIVHKCAHARRTRVEYDNIFHRFPPLRRAALRHFSAMRRGAESDTPTSGTAVPILQICPFRKRRCRPVTEKTPQKYGVSFG